MIDLSRNGFAEKRDELRIELVALSKIRLH